MLKSVTLKSPHSFIIGTFHGPYTLYGASGIKSKLRDLAENRDIEAIFVELPPDWGEELSKSTEDMRKNNPKRYLQLASIGYRDFCSAVCGDYPS